MRSDPGLPGATSGLKETFERLAARIRERFEHGEGGHEVAALHSSEVDAILRRLFDDACRLVGRDPSGACLVALGGYGRRELAPFSDIDLLLVHRGWPAEQLKELNRLLFYPLWDAGKELGNRSRDIGEAVRMLDRVDEASAVLDARHLAGDQRLHLDFEGAVLDKLHRVRAGFFRGLHTQTQRRHQSFGHAGHLLEPHLRDSAGGLRDLHTLGWAAKLLPGSDGLPGLVEQGFLSQQDRIELEEAAAFLLRARFGLHLIAGRKQDKLYLAEQDRLAASLEHEPEGGLGAGDAYMRVLYRRARSVDAITRSVWDRLLRPGRRRFMRTGGTKLGVDGCVVRDGRVEVVALPPPDTDAAPWLRAFLASVRSDVTFNRSSLNWLTSMLGDGRAAAWTPEARDAFVEILDARADAPRVLESLDACGLLGALIPEWSPVRCCPQRNPYHRYTVDMHSFHAVAELGGGRDEAAVASAWEAAADHVPLLLAALFHDIGKGRGGEHSRIGAELAATATRRMGFGDSVVQDVAFLVREHLLLPELAVRRDLTDPRTIEQAARRAGDVRRLAMLYLLCRADSLATGPEAWSSFRASLVGELYSRTRRAIEAGRSAHRETATPARLLGLMREVPETGDVRATLLETRPVHELAFVARDRPGLFATVSGVLALRGLDVLGAEIYTGEDGAALEVFRVGVPGGELTTERLASVRVDVARALAAEFDLDAELARLPRPSAGAPGPPPRVIVDSDASADCTVVEVHASDRPGLLRAITKALADHHCDVRVARVATYGTDVVDVFYVRRVTGGKLDASSAGVVCHAVLDALHRLDAQL